MPVFLTARVHPFPFRTRKLSSPVPTILARRRAGKIGQCRRGRVRKRTRSFFYLARYFLPAVISMWAGGLPPASSLDAPVGADDPAARCAAEILGKCSGSGRRRRDSRHWKTGRTVQSRSFSAPGRDYQRRGLKAPPLIDFSFHILFVSKKNMAVGDFSSPGYTSTCFWCTPRETAADE